MEKADAARYLKKTDLDIQSAHAAIWICDLAYTAYANSTWVHKQVFSPIFCFVSYRRLDSHFQFMSKEKIILPAKQMYIDFKKNKKAVLYKIREHKDYTDKLAKIWTEYKKRRVNISNNLLLRYYKDVVRHSRKIWGYTTVGEDKGHIVDELIVPNFIRRHNIPKVKARRIVHSLSHPRQMSLINLQRKKMLELCLEYLKRHSFEDKKVKRLIRGFARGYFFSRTGFYKAEDVTAEYVKDHILKETVKHSRKELLEEYKKIEKNFKSLHKKSKVKIRLTNEDKDDLRFAEQMIYWVDVRKLCMLKQLYFSLSLLKDIAERFGMQYHDLAVYNVDEVLRLLETGEKTDKALLEKRDEGAFMIFEKGSKIRNFYGSDAFELFNSANETHESQIKGMVASKGKANLIRGKVSIILNPAKNRFTEGRILATSMTRPEFVPLMRKAKAIITNEGGIACHAAIISRELGIPCIIGTKNATKLLQDGDEVEMDMRSGVVKIIK